MLEEQKVIQYYFGKSFNLLAVTMLLSDQNGSLVK